MSVTSTASSTASAVLNNTTSEFMNTDGKITPAAVVTASSYLTLHYRVALSSEEAIDSDIVSTFGDRPATLQLGLGQLSEALEARLIGLRSGEHVTFEFAPGEAFGPRNPELIQKISRATLDAESGADAGVENNFQPGDLVQFAAPNGGNYAGVLKEINERYALFDFNHPLAGQPVRFEVQIIGVL